MLRHQYWGRFFVLTRGFPGPKVPGFQRAAGPQRLKAVGDS